MLPSWESGEGPTAGSWWRVNLREGGGRSGEAPDLVESCSEFSHRERWGEHYLGVFPTEVGQTAKAKV